MIGAWGKVRVAEGSPWTALAPGGAPSVFGASSAAAADGRPSGPGGGGRRSPPPAAALLRRGPGPAGRGVEWVSAPRAAEGAFVRGRRPLSRSQALLRTRRGGPKSRSRTGTG